MPATKELYEYFLDDLIPSPLIYIYAGEPISHEFAVFIGLVAIKFCESAIDRSEGRANSNETGQVVAE
jgi:hypothetical protein